MKKNLFICFLLCPFSALASNGAAPFFNDPAIVGKHQPIKHYSRPKDATTMLQGKLIPFCLWYNQKEWKIDSREKELAEEIYFSSKDGILMAQIIAEIVPIPKDEIQGLVWENAEKNFENVRFLLTEERVVNSLPLYCYQWIGYYAGKEEKFKRGHLYIFYGYVYTHPSGTVHVVTSTTQGAFDLGEKKMTDFLNGFTWCRGT